MFVEKNLNLKHCSPKPFTKMRRTYLAVILVILSTYTCDGFGRPRNVRNTTKSLFVPGLDTALPIFLRDAMSKYPNWIKDNQDDPSMPIVMPVSIAVEDYFASVSLQIRNQHMAGMSKAIGYSSGNAWVDLDNEFFWVSQTTNQELVVGGDYEASGTLTTSNISFSGYGKFTVSLSIPAQALFYEYVTVSTDGKYLNLATADVDYTCLPIIGGPALFQGIRWSSESGNYNYTEDINSFLQYVYYEYIKNTTYPDATPQPAARQFQNYVSDLIFSTPIAKILEHNSTTGEGSNSAGFKFKNELVITFFCMIFVKFATFVYYFVESNF